MKFDEGLAGAVSLPLRVSLRQLLMQRVRRRVRPLRALLPTLRTAVEVGLSRHAGPAVLARRAGSAPPRCSIT